MTAQNLAQFGHPDSAIFSRAGGKQEDSPGILRCCQFKRKLHPNTSQPTNNCHTAYTITQTLNEETVRGK